jgi:hypothetical protein
VLVTSISEGDIRNIVASPHALVGSDGNCVAPYRIHDSTAHFRVSSRATSVMSTYYHSSRPSIK